MPHPALDAQSPLADGLAGIGSPEVQHISLDRAERCMGAMRLFQAAQALSVVLLAIVALAWALSQVASAWTRGDPGTPSGSLPPVITYLTASAYHVLLLVITYVIATLSLYSSRQVIAAFGALAAVPGLVGNGRALAGGMFASYVLAAAWSAGTGYYLSIYLLASGIVALIVWLSLSYVAACLDLARARPWEWVLARGFLPAPLNIRGVVLSSLGIPFPLQSLRYAGPLLLPKAALALSTLALSAAAAYTYRNMTSGYDMHADTSGYFAYGSSYNFALEIAQSVMAITDTWVNDYILVQPIYRLDLIQIKLLQCAIAIAVLWPPAWALGRYARRALAIGYDKARQADERRPLLYLRPFREDQVALPVIRRRLVHRLLGSFGEPRRFEEHLVRVGAPYGPVVAIGPPEAPLPTFGAAKRFVREGDWREVVGSLVAESALVVIQAAETEGVAWEIGELRRQDRLRNVLVFFSAKLERGRRAAILQEVFDIPAPAEDSMGTPIAALLHSGRLIVLSARSEGTDSVQAALRFAFLAKCGCPAGAWARPCFQPLAAP